MNTRRLTSAALAAALMLSSLGATLTPASLLASPPATERARVSVDFKEISLQELVIFISALTEQNFIILDRDLRDRTLTVYAPEPVTPEQASDLLLTAMRMQGLKIEHNGDFWTISAP